MIHVTFSPKAMLCAKVNILGPPEASDHHTQARAFHDLTCDVTCLLRAYILQGKLNDTYNWIVPLHYALYTCVNTAQCMLAKRYALHWRMEVLYLAFDSCLLFYLNLNSDEVTF